MSKFLMMVNGIEVSRRNWLTLNESLKTNPELTLKVLNRYLKIWSEEKEKYGQTR